MCLQLQISFLVKNPARSYIWLFPVMMQLANDSRDEAEYPLVLCQRFARLVKQHYGKIKLKRRALAAAARGGQPRGRRIPKVISEYKCTKNVILTVHPHLDGKTAFQ
jgi:hypothetical protein